MPLVASVPCQANRSVASLPGGERSMFATGGVASSVVLWMPE
jgi:hypothetical protein